MQITETASNQRRQLDIVLMRNSAVKGFSVGKVRHHEVVPASAYPALASTAAASALFGTASPRFGWCFLGV